MCIFSPMMINFALFVLNLFKNDAMFSQEIYNVTQIESKCRSTDIMLSINTKYCVLWISQNQQILLITNNAYCVKVHPMVHTFLWKNICALKGHTLFLKSDSSIPFFTYERLRYKSTLVFSEQKRRNSLIFWMAFLDKRKRAIQKSTEYVFFTHFF